MPRDVLKFLESGAFACSVSGKHTCMRSVALDEAHEMLMNKDLNTIVVRPSKEYLDYMLYYYLVRSVVLNEVKNAILLETGTKSGEVSVFDPSQQLAKIEENVKCMMAKVQSSNTLDVLDEVRPLTSMSGQAATPEQQIDLLGFWEVGHERFEDSINFFLY